MISLVLYDAEKETNNKFSGYEIVDIIERLKESYGLDFSETEVFDAISHSKNSAIVCISEKPKKYTISVPEIDRIESKVERNPLLEIINDFIQYEDNKKRDAAEGTGTVTDEGKQFSSDEVQNLLYKYFYTLFNSNASYIRSFLGQNYDTDKLSDSDFNTEEKS